MTGRSRGLFKHYDDLRDQAEAAEEAATAATIRGGRPEEIQVYSEDIASEILLSCPCFGVAFIRNRLIQSGPSGCTPPFVDIKTKGLSQYRFLILKPATFNLMSTKVSVQPT